MRSGFGAVVERNIRRASDAGGCEDPVQLAVWARPSRVLQVDRVRAEGAGVVCDLRLDPAGSARAAKPSQACQASRSFAGDRLARLPRLAPCSSSRL